MKIGTVVTLFDKNWPQMFAPILAEKFDYFELLPENEDVYEVAQLREYFQEKELILHAPFIEANLIAKSEDFRRAAREFLVKRLKPLVDEFNPQVITTHAGTYPDIYPVHDYSEIKKLLTEIPVCSLENMPGGDNMWRRSFPGTESECDKLFSEVNSKMTFDVGHFMKQGLDVYALLEKYLPRIVDVHIHDIIDGKDHKELGTGNLDLKRMTDILKKFDYQHYVSIELHHDNVQGMINSLSLLRSYLD